ncbi:unnamed protein product [Arabidopsis halleri]
MEEQRIMTPLFLWGFGPKITEDYIFNFVDWKRESSLISVRIVRDSFNMGCAILIYTDPFEASAHATALHNLPLGIGHISTSLVSFPEVLQGEREALKLEVSRQGMMKTELCNRWLKTGPCHLGDNCPFAHGTNELPPVLTHPRYRTEVSSTMATLPTVLVTGASGRTGKNFFNFVAADFDFSSLSSGQVDNMAGQGSMSQALYEGAANIPQLQANTLRHQEIDEGFKRGSICYVGNFRFDLTEVGLRDLFSPFGEVISCKIRRFQDSGLSRGDGFVEFVTPQEALRDVDPCPAMLSTCSSFQGISQFREILKTNSTKPSPLLNPES